MSIKCTYGDVGQLRDLPGQTGVLAKLYNLVGVDVDKELPTVVDRFRLVRFVRAVGGVVAEYIKMLGEIGAKYGEPVQEPGGFTVFHIKPEFRQAFEDEKAKLNEMECEISVDPLPLSTYEKISLTPRELASLEKFVVQPDG